MFRSDGTKSSKRLLVMEEDHAIATKPAVHVRAARVVVHEWCA